MNTKRIILISSVLILLLGLIAAVYIVLFEKVDLFSNASPEQTPQQIKITNISDNAFTVSWVTPDKPTIGFVEFGIDNKYGNIANDDRDIASQSPRFTHHITVKNLNPSTRYSFRVGSDSKKFDNTGSPFVISTAATTDSTPPLPDNAFGKITPQGSDILVYLNFENASPLSTYTKDDGNWLVTLNNARNDSLSDYFTVKSDTRISLTATNGQKVSQGSFTAINKAPVPTVSLGENVVFATVSTTPSPNVISNQLTAAGGLTEVTPSISPSPTIKDSPTPSPKVSTSPSPKVATVAAEPVPVTGTFENTIIMVGGGLILVFVGLIIAL